MAQALVPAGPSLRTPDVVELEVSPAAAICALRAGKLACRRPFRPPGGLESAPAARIGCRATGARPHGTVGFELAGNELANRALFGYYDD